MTERVLCVVAHPDDETLFAGGILTLMSQHDFESHVLCATRGEGGERGDVVVATREELGAVRVRELHCAARVLGIASVRFLDYVDPPVGPGNVLFPYTEHVDELAQRIVAVIEEIRPTLMLTHGSGGEYGHPAHQVTHQGAVRAHALARERGIEPHLYTFSANVPDRQDRVFNLNDPADVVIDVTPWLQSKAAAAECHRSQHGLFYRNHPEAESLLEVVRSLESLRRVWPAEGPHPKILAPYLIEQRPK